jgi:hypothetical protein
MADNLIQSGVAEERLMAKKSDLDLKVCSTFKKMSLNGIKFVIDIITA